ncbi:MAG: hypothetical protein FWD81_00245 [Methanomassiliicoccaceae archaeon]|nr:hypothetical protein [Methanomassiliicoccaceae archaeon]
MKECEDCDLQLKVAEASEWPQEGKENAKTTSDPWGRIRRAMDAKKRAEREQRSIISFPEE